jgi:hypothetical protein
VKTAIPEELKRELPQTRWGKILTVTPVVMTVVATLLAGLASSEMTRAQYERALGAQIQSKAGDQWGYFQAKKLRGAMQKNSLELLQAIGEVRPTDAALLAKLPVPPELRLDPAVQSALDAAEAQKPESEVATLVRAVPEPVIQSSLKSAREVAEAFEVASSPLLRDLDRMEKELPKGDRDAARDFAGTRMRINAARYESEARLNQVVAQLLELQVRKVNLAAERHRSRSGKFFLGMLSAQAAVIIATFAIATQKRNFLWSVAAVAGVAAIAFAIYVYLQV